MVASRKPVGSESKKEAKTVTAVLDPAKIIQGYLSHDTISFLDSLPDNSLSSRPDRSEFSFFGKTVLLLAHTAASHIFCGNPNKAIEIIMGNPGILFHTIERTSLSGGAPRQGTLYQFLLWLDDNYSIRMDKNDAVDKEGKTFTQSVRDILVSYPGGIEEEARQRESWFHGWSERTHVERLRAEFDKVAKAFDESKAIEDDELDRDDKLQEAILTFTKYLADTIRAPKNCIPQLWDYASIFYNSSKFEEYGGNSGDYYGSPKNKLFCSKILGSIDFHLPVWGLQVLKRLNAGWPFADRQDVSFLFKDLQISSEIVVRLGESSFIDRFGERTNWDAHASDGSAACEWRASLKDFSVFSKYQKQLAPQSDPKLRPVQKSPENCLVM